MVTAPYLLAMEAARLHARCKAGTLPAVVFLTDQERVHTAEAIKSLPSRSIVILRDYGLLHRAHYVKTMVALSRKHGHTVLVAGDEPLAIAVRADGMHFPEKAWRKALYCKLRHPAWIISVAAHNRHSLQRLAKTIDFAVFSPIFPTESHPGAAPVGALRYRMAARHTPFPVYPLGGVNAQSVRQLKSCFTPGIAAISGLVEL